MTRRRFTLLVSILALVVSAFAAPSALAAGKLVANVAPWAPMVSPSGNISTLRLDCAAADPDAVRVDVHCWTSNGADASVSSAAPAAAVDQVAPVGGNPLLSFSSFTFCADATFHYANGSTYTTELGCVVDDFGTATVIGQ